MPSPLVRLVCHRVFLPILQPRCSRSISSAYHQTRNLFVCASHRQHLKEGQFENTTHTSSNADIEDKDKPLQYSTSKAREWSVGNSFGKHRAKENSGKKVAAICTVSLALVAWIFLRKESEIDRMLERDLNETLASLKDSKK